MKHALSHHSLREGVPGELDGLHRYFLPTPRMHRDGNTLEAKAGENRFFVASSSLEGPAETQRVCDVSFLSSHQSQRDTDVVQVFAGVLEYVSWVSWHHTLRCRLCWSMETIALMNSPSIGSLKCLLFDKNNPGYVCWLETQSGRTQPLLLALRFGSQEL